MKLSITIGSSVTCACSILTFSLCRRLTAKPRSAELFDLEVYNVVVDQRPKPGGMNGKQNTGFAYKKGLNVQVQPDFEELDVSNGGLRYGSRIDLAIGGQTILLMSVHLKSGCFENSMSGSDCNTLMRQVPVPGKLD